MKTFDVRAYSISDFAEWYGDGKLDLSPEFQRRSVWSSSAKAFLADTIIKGKPFPKIILMQEFKDGKTVRVVVDGQQRLRAIFDFLNDGIRISRAHSREFAGKTFSQLPDEVKEDFMTYQVGCDILNSAPLNELLDIFARINRYSVKLNKQEMRNANFSGFFKSAAYEIGYSYVDYWLNSRVLSKSHINRMSEAELASDLLACFLVEKIQSVKSIDVVYKNFEEEEGRVPAAMSALIEAIDLVASIYDEDELRSSSWRSKHLYFTLVCCVGHVFSPFDNVRESRLTPADLENKGKVRSILNGIASDYAAYSPQPKRVSAPPHLRDFIRNSTLATTDAKARVARIEYVLSVLEESLGY